MRTLIRLIFVGGVCLVLDACSAPRPSSPVDPGKPAPPPAPAAAVSSATPEAKPNKIVLEDKTLTNDEVQALITQGYKPVGRNGVVYYCRREQETGSHFTTMSCKSADQMKQIAQDSKDLLSAKQRPGGCMAQGAGC